MRSFIKALANKELSESLSICLISVYFYLSYNGKCLYWKDID